MFNDSPIPGYEVRIVDGNHHPASEHRLEALRDVAAAPLPGFHCRVRSSACIVVDCVPCEDGHKQERALVPEVQNAVEAVRCGSRIETSAPVHSCLSCVAQAYFVVRRTQ